MAQIKLNATYGLTGALPAVSGANLTSLTSGNLTGALPAISGASLTGISGGKLLAHVSSGYGTQQSSTSSTWADMNLATAAITPATSGSKFFVILNTVGECGGSGVRLGLRLIANYDASDSVIISRSIALLSGGGSLAEVKTVSVTHAPSTTSAILWKAEFMNQLSSATSVQVHANNYTSTLSVFELGE